MDRLGAETPNSRAMLGSAVASTVPSSCSMNMAAPTIRAMVRKWGLGAPDSGMTLPADYDQAVAAHRRGELGEAERLYRRLLEAAPSSVAARHMLGILRAQS